MDCNEQYMLGTIKIEFYHRLLHGRSPYATFWPLAYFKFKDN